MEQKASIRVMRRWLVSIMDDTENMTEQDRWMARQILDFINEKEAN